jgi:signal transduction histidine kinase
MDPFAISLAVVSGICLGTGLLHLFIGLRRQGTDMRHFTFGLFAVAYSGAVLTGLLMYRATTLPQYLGADRWSGVFAGVTYIFLIWFVAVYTDVQPLPVLGLLTALFAALIAAHVSRPTLIHGEIMGITFATLPWGEQVAFLDAAESTWELVFFFTQLLTIAFLFYACIRQFRRGERGEALTLGVGLVLFVATIVFDILVESGAVDFVLASDFGFLPLAIVMSIRLSNDVIRTEEELARYRRELEARVEQRTSQLQRANEDLAALNRIVQTLASVTELPGALERVSETVANLFSAQHVYIVLPSAPEAGLQVMVGYQQGSGPVGATPLPAPLTETAYFERVLSQAESLTLSDVQALPVAGPMRKFVARQGIQSAMLVPLVVRGSAIGLLAVATDDSGRVFTPDQVRLAETIAGDVAGAIENARLFDQAQAAAVSEERGRIARDLHDSVTQTLYSASLIAEALPRVWERNPAEVKGNLTALVRLIRGALAEMRTLLFELRPAAVKEASLSRLLHQQADVLTGRTQTPVEVTIQGQADPPAEVKVALYRIAQEALNNVTKHAGATQVTVALQNLPDRVLLTIQDDGRGFDPDSVAPERMGVRIMHERAKSIGAELVVESAPGQGTRVQVECPAEKESPNEWDQGHPHHAG